MISYQWHLSPDQPFNKDDLCRLQYCLFTAGIFLDLSWNEDSVVMRISVPEDLMEKADAQQAENDTDSPSAEDPPAETSGTRRKRGRPSAVVKNDLTLARIHHMRLMNVSVGTIAEELGVSRRTFYRRWKLAEKRDIDESTPFSQWPEQSGRCAKNR